MYAKVLENQICFEFFHVWNSLVLWLQNACENAARLLPNGTINKLINN